MTKSIPNQEDNTENQNVEPKYKELINKEAELLNEINERRDKKENFGDVQKLIVEVKELRIRAVEAFSELKTIGEISKDLQLLFNQAFSEYPEKEKQKNISDLKILEEAIENNIKNLTKKLEKDVNSHEFKLFTYKLRLEKFSEGIKRYKKELKSKAKAEPSTKPEKEQLNKPKDQQKEQNSIKSKFRKLVKRLKPEKAISWVKRVISKKKTGAGKETSM